MNLSSPWMSLLGGALIGVSATLLLRLNGRIAGISGILGGILRPQRGELAWRVLFVAGLFLGGVLVRWRAPSQLAPSQVPLGVIAVAGLLVGFGARLGAGCTSGHGVCGVSRLSTRSLVATAVFMAAGMAATYAVQHVLPQGIRL